MVHGTADRQVPYAGGHGASQPTSRLDPSVATVVQWWAAHNRCVPLPLREQTGRILRETYAGCADDAEVILETIQGGGHAWPGGRQGWRFGDAPAPEVSASRLMWDFFTRHPAPRKNL